MARLLTDQPKRKGPSWRTKILRAVVKALQPAIELLITTPLLYRIQADQREKRNRLWERTEEALNGVRQDFNWRVHQFVDGAHRAAMMEVAEALLELGSTADYQEERDLCLLLAGKLREISEGTRDQGETDGE